MENVDPDSIRVRTEKGRCEILEVSSAVKHSAVAAEAEEGPQAEARKAMEEKRDAVAEKKAELERIKQRDCENVKCEIYRDADARNADAIKLAFKSMPWFK